ncbi:NAD-dependent protein deacetylase sirtuin-3-like [Limulus polyphemus]|uniref:NAD-dependent protein deacetylase sirtuin-3-like n=1 Tax=Limulus polyphemus TaxID=6850 RepID=A0ABM1SUX9_LIMPO|nr:NAD-dependent protein deacetylase sirtuin-3-like [Limulus polyphemus]
MFKAFGSCACFYRSCLEVWNTIKSRALMAAAVGKSTKLSKTKPEKSKNVEPPQISQTSTSPSLVKKFSELSIKKTEEPKTKKNSKTKQPSRACSSSSSKHENYKTLDDIAAHILRPTTTKIVVMAGAGISTPSGIPDFRSPGTGLYDNIQKYNLPYPEAVFDIDYFYMDQRPFFALAKELYPGNYSPNEVHYFVKLLHEKKKLLRMYTQNIDGLERLAGIPSEKLVEAHGSFNTASCIKCGTKYSSEEIKVRKLVILIFQPLAHKVSFNNFRVSVMFFEILELYYSVKVAFLMNLSLKGVVKPDITFFGEQLPARFWYHMTDMPRADLLIVMGTSLEVEPFASISELVWKKIPRLLINRDTVGSFRAGGENDVIQTGDILENVNSLIHKLNWESDFKKILVK